jgi:HSP20 family molecular chaperone IbpA
MEAFRAVDRFNGAAELAQRRSKVAMTRLSVFNSPLLLGFDHLERMLDRVGKSSAEGYPPYNIEQTGENGLRITLAVAGFREDDLAVQVEDNQLLIRGKQAVDDSRIYLHRGIAARQFQRSFILAEGLEVTSARLEHGLLHIDLVRPAPESRVRTVKISSAGAVGRANGTAGAPGAMSSGAMPVQVTGKSASNPGVKAPGVRGSGDEESER